MINYTEARTIVRSKAHSFGTETIPLEQSYGRVLTGVVRADRDYPPFDRATMDGYALRAIDLQQGIRAFVGGTDLRPGDVVQQGRLPAAERESHRILVGAAGRLADEIQGCEQLDGNEAHGVLPIG